MYKVINFLAFVGCIVWLLLEPSPEPVVVLLLSVAGFFRDDIHGVIGKNIFSLTPKTRLIRNLKSAKYSFVDSEFINPRILEDLVGWASDSGNQVISINIADSNCSNRYFCDVSHERLDNGYPRVTSSYDGEWFSYQYLGVSFSGIHLVRTWSNGGGSGVFCDVLMVTLCSDSVLDYREEKSMKNDRYVVKMVGLIPLGDKFEGRVSYKMGLLNIQTDDANKSLARKRMMLVI